MAQSVRMKVVGGFVGGLRAVELFFRHQDSCDGSGMGTGFCGLVGIASWSSERSSIAAAKDANAAIVFLLVGRFPNLLNAGAVSASANAVSSSAVSVVLASAGRFAGVALASNLSLSLGVAGTRIGAGAVGAGVSPAVRGA